MNTTLVRVFILSKIKQSERYPEVDISKAKLLFFSVLLSYICAVNVLDKLPQLTYCLEITSSSAKLNSLIEARISLLNPVQNKCKTFDIAWKLVAREIELVGNFIYF